MRKFTQADYDAFNDDPRMVDVFYDHLEMTPELQRALDEGIVKYTQDKDVTKRSKTGVVFRLVGRELSPDKPIPFNETSFGREVHKFYKEHPPEDFD